MQDLIELLVNKDAPSSNDAGTPALTELQAISDYSPNSDKHAPNL